MPKINSSIYTIINGGSKVTLFTYNSQIRTIKINNQFHISIKTSFFVMKASIFLSIINTSCIKNIKSKEVLFILHLLAYFLMYFRVSITLILNNNYEEKFIDFISSIFIL